MNKKDKWSILNLPDWSNLKPANKINVLSNESTVLPDLLMECKPLIDAIKQGESQEACLNIINENF